MFNLAIQFWQSAVIQDNSWHTGQASSEQERVLTGGWDTGELRASARVGACAPPTPATDGVRVCIFASSQLEGWCVGDLRA